MHVIGTAGHVDHGKSTLVSALTGIDPDRLKEEKERKMTIDLGFAWLRLLSGEVVGIVDVPGHKDFIKNMLAGVGGIDAALLVVAADEGIMPQTREHLAILDLLGVEAGVVAITKSDLAEDEEWLDLVMAEIAGELQGTCLENAPLIPVSARTGAGLPELAQALDQILAGTRPHRDIGYPRLSVDRIFSISGFGTVVTGTLLDGQLKTGQEVEILPKGLKARIRGLQTHKQKLDVALPSNRVAVNLTGVAATDLTRGNVLTVPGWLTPTILIDARLRHLKGSPIPLKHNMSLDFFCGAAQTAAILRLLDKETLLPGDSGWVQLRLAEPIVMRKGDRFIVRLASPSVTVGGGVIVDVHPRRRHRRFREEVSRHLETQAHGSPEEVLLQALESQEPCEVKELVKRSGLGEAVAAEALSTLVGQGHVLMLRDQGGPLPAPNIQSSNALLVSNVGWRRLVEQVATLLKSYHQQFPLRKGIPKEEAKSKLRLTPRVFSEVMSRAVREGHVREQGVLVNLPEHEVAFDAETQRRVNSLLDTFHKQPYATPSVQDSEKLIGSEALNALVEQDILVKVQNDVLFLRETYDAMVEQITQVIQERGSITVAEVRDMFQASRKYALGLMEYLDEKKITRRQGDARVLR